MAVERCWERMLPATFDQWRPRWYAMQAIACVDTAIWDAVGKALASRCGGCGAAIGIACR